MAFFWLVGFFGLGRFCLFGWFGGFWLGCFAGGVEKVVSFPKLNMWRNSSVRDAGAGPAERLQNQFPFLTLSLVCNEAMQIWQAMDKPCKSRQ